MTADLHGHFFPAKAARGVVPSVRLEPSNEGYDFFVGTQQTRLSSALLDLHHQVDDMANHGIAIRAISVPPFTFQYELPAEHGVNWARAINDGIAEAVAGYPEQFVGFATLPMQDIPSAVEELDRAIHTLGLNGVEIATNINGVELDAPELDPFWQRAANLRTPILIHPHYVAGVDRMGDYHLRNLVGNPTETALAGARLMFGGVLDRFPDLRIILSHGGGALPQIIGRLCHGYNVRPEAQAKGRDPVEQCKRLYYDTIVFDSGALRHLVDLVGASQIIVGTDYPFDMSEEEPVEFVRNAGLPTEEIETILGNGRRLLEQ